MRIVKLKGMRQVNGLHYAPDGRRLLAVGGYEMRSVDEARWVDVDAGTETLRVPLNALSYAVSHDLSKIAVGNSRPYQDQHIPVVVFDPADSDWLDQGSRWQEVPLAVDEPHTNCDVHALAFAPTGEQLAFSYSFIQSVGNLSMTLGGIQTSNLNSGQHHKVGIPTGPVTSTCFAPDGQDMITLGESIIAGAVVSRSAKTLAFRSSFFPSTTETRGVVFSPDGGTLAVANAKSVLLLPPDLSAPRHTLAHPKQVNAVAFTPDGRRILTTCTDKLVRVWDATTGQLVTSYDWNVGVTNAVAVAPDGLTAAVSGQTGRVVLFDLDG